jgi:hypothetical protein
MKKFIIAGFVVVLLIICAFLFWPHSRIPSDKVIRENISGTWVIDLSSVAHSTIVVGADGGYVCRMTGANGRVTATLEGTFAVTNGYLVDTVTKSSLANERVPNTSRGRIVLADGHEMVVSHIGANAPVVMRKVAR